MPIINLSSINQKIVNENKEKDNNQQPYVDLSQKADTVSFSSKKVARNTGIGAVVGFIIGSITKHFKNKDVKINIDAIDEKGGYVYQEAQKAITEQEDKLFNDFLQNGRSAVEKLAQNKELTQEEKAIAKACRLDTPVMNYMYKNEEFLNAALGIFKEDIPKAAFRAHTQTTDIQLGQTYRNALQKITEEYFENYSQYSKTGEYPELIKASGEDYIKLVKNAIESLDKNDFDEAGNVEFPGLLYTRKINANPDFMPLVDKQTQRILNSNDWKGFYPDVDFIKDNIDNFKLKLEGDIKSQILKKESLKAAGIGTAIVGGIALAGSLIYKAVKNKKTEQNKSS